MTAVIVLIPAFEPDLRLVALVRALAAAGDEILVLDDGSGPAYDGVFDVAGAAGATVVRYPINRGKGAALKTGFAWIEEHRPGQDVVCADCDGQHTPTDIRRVAEAVRPGIMTLGGRRFTGTVPFRSRLGNAVSRALFRLATGVRVHDTQTGLRAYPAALVPWLRGVEGERFEYEFNLLLRAREAGVAIHEIEIETIYLEANASSHFRPLADSARIYAPLLAFASTSLIGYGVDVVLVLLLHGLTHNLLVAVVGARIASGTLNFTLNRTVVFGRQDDPRRAALRYWGLAGTLLAANYALMYLLVTLAAWPLVLAKALVEASLFLTSYAVQRRVVFAHRTSPEVAPAPQHTSSTRDVAA